MSMYVGISVKQCGRLAVDELEYHCFLCDEYFDSSADDWLDERDGWHELRGHLRDKHAALVIPWEKLRT